MGKIHPHSNKWLLYSSLVIFVGVLLSDLGTVRFVKCVAHGEDSNDIGTRHVDKIPGKSPGKSVSLPSSASNSANNHDSNEVHSTNFRFPGSSASALDDEEEGDEDSYEDGEDASYYDHDDFFASSDELKKVSETEVQYLDQYERDNKKFKPQIAKCCPYGEAINSDGRCSPFRSLEAKHHQK